VTKDRTINYDDSPFDEYDIISTNQLMGLCFVKKQDYIYDSDNDILGIKAIDDEGANVYLKIYFNLNQPDVPYIMLSAEPKDTLASVLRRLIDDGYIVIANSHSYYFTEHNNIDDSQYIDNELNMNMELRYLNNFELDVSCT
jgi:hypothetical protein